MQAENRMRTLRLINKIEKYNLYCEQIGVEDVSTFHGKLLEEKENEKDAAKEYEVLSMT